MYFKLVVVIFILSGCVPSSQFYPDTTINITDENIRHYPKTSDSSNIIYKLTSNIQKTDFYVDGKKMFTGRRGNVLIDNKPHVVIASPEGYHSKEEYIQPPYLRGALLSFTFLLEDKLPYAQQDKINNEKISSEISSMDMSSNSLPDVNMQDATDIQSVENSSGDIDFGDFYALVIGINAYADLPQLQTARNDAISIAKILKQKYGFQVKLLLDAKRSAIMDSLRYLRSKLDAKDSLLIYYAGHGWLDEQADQGYWLPVDATKESEVNWISNSYLTSTIKAIEAKHILIVADSCYSGKLTRGIKIKRTTPSYIARMAKKRARVALTSGGLEPVLDSGGEGSHSVFASAFLKVLGKNQGIIDGSEIFTSIRRSVIVNSDQTPEYGDIRRAGHDGGDFLFIPNK